MTMTSGGGASGINEVLTAALRDADAVALSKMRDLSPRDARDRFAALLTIYDLHTGAVEDLGDAARFQHHPSIAALKSRLENHWLDELSALTAPDDIDMHPERTDDVVASMRALAARDRLPAVYKWLARSASWDEGLRSLGRCAGRSRKATRNPTRGRISRAGMWRARL